MRILVTGCCGFVGSSLLKAFQSLSVDQRIHLELVGIDNLRRAGSELNRGEVTKLGARFFHGDVRLSSDLDSIPPVDWVIDASANPSTLAGVDGVTSSRQVVEHNLLSTINLLEFCKLYHAGLILLSTSRVYSIESLRNLPIIESVERFQLDPSRQLLSGISPAGLAEDFSTRAPISLYGSTKLASELLALEYNVAFDIPVWINRCGVLAGKGQFGRPDQGIVAFWIHSWAGNNPLTYIGFQGSGCQVRDCLHTLDLADLVWQQMTQPVETAERIYNVGGGPERSFSLRQLSVWCGERFGPRTVNTHVQERPFDVPWLIMDSARAQRQWNWQPSVSLESIWNEIAEHATKEPNWLEVSERP